MTRGLMCGFMIKSRNEIYLNKNNVDVFVYKIQREI